VEIKLHKNLPLLDETAFPDWFTKEMLQELAMSVSLMETVESFKLFGITGFWRGERNPSGPLDIIGSVGFVAYDVDVDPHDPIQIYNFAEALILRDPNSPLGFTISI